ncbi:hypothetical protein D3C77_734300 [compost metagenome]
MLGGGFVDAFVDGGQHHVRQPGHQHADRAAAPRLQAGRVGVGLVLQFGGKRPDAFHRVRGRCAARIVFGSVQDPGHG